MSRSIDTGSSSSGSSSIPIARKRVGREGNEETILTKKPEPRSAAASTSSEDSDSSLESDDEGLMFSFDDRDDPRVPKAQVRASSSQSTAPRTPMFLASSTSPDLDRLLETRPQRARNALPFGIISQSDELVRPRRVEAFTGKPLLVNHREPSKDQIASKKLRELEARSGLVEAHRDEEIRLPLALEQAEFQRLLKEKEAAANSRFGRKTANLATAAAPVAAARGRSLSRGSSSGRDSDSSSSSSSRSSSSSSRSSSASSTTSLPKIKLSIPGSRRSKTITGPNLP